MPEKLRQTDQDVFRQADYQFYNADGLRGWYRFWWIAKSNLFPLSISIRSRNNTNSQRSFTCLPPQSTGAPAAGGSLLTCSSGIQAWDTASVVAYAVDVFLEDDDEIAFDLATGSTTNVGYLGLELPWATLGNI